MKHSAFYSIILTGFLILLFTMGGCRKTEKETENLKGDINIKLKYNIDGDSLIFDSLLYQNLAGQIYSVSRLEYYLSDFYLISNQGELKLEKIKYLTARKESEFVLDGIPFGDYTGIRFILGIDSLNNKPNALPLSIENNSMFWPIQMGGGYHFMKLEGYFIDSLRPVGYAMHLGQQGNEVTVEFNSPFKVSNSGHQAELNMNINRWFEDPNTYDFVKDGRYTMSSMPLMKKLSENGRNVFEFNFIK